MAETPPHRFRVSDDLWDAAGRTLKELDDRLHIAVRVEPGMSRSAVLVELIRVLAEDVQPRRGLQLLVGEAGPEARVPPGGSTMIVTPS